MTDRRALRYIALATFLTLVPITLLVPGLNELVIETHGGTRFQAHLFVSLNQLAGIIAVPFAMVMQRRFPGTRAWIPLMLLVNAAAFIGMREADSLTELYAWRALDGFMHLPAVTFLMIAANRAGVDYRRLRAARDNPQLRRCRRTFEPLHRPDRHQRTGRMRGGGGP